MRTVVGAVALLLAVAAFVVADPPAGLDAGDVPLWWSFEAYQKVFGKAYPDDDTAMLRFENYKLNMAWSAALNAEEGQTAVFGETEFSDLSRDEFAERYLMRNFTATLHKHAHQIHATPRHGPAKTGLGSYATKKDWVADGRVRAVRNQGSCGSCWAFSTAADIEGRMLARGIGVDLSPQMLIDCDNTDEGCNGGYPEYAFAWLYPAGGLMTLGDYPYKGYVGTCKLNTAKAMYNVNSGSTTQPASENAVDIYQYIYDHGPTTAAIDASQLQNYNSGVLSRPTSTCQNLDHAVLLVGYDSTYSPAYFKVKNSWGTSWGESGYFRVTPTTCLINTLVRGSN